MNCATCGRVLPQGVQMCPYCGAPVQPYAYTPYQQNYPTGYQQPYTYGQAPEKPELLTVLSDLPRAFWDSYTRPGEVLRGMVEKRDWMSGIIVSAVVLGLAFLSGMVLMRGFIGVLFTAIARVTGVSMANTSASMNQGISYIAGRIGPAVGGVAALCQLIGMLVPAAVFLIYICAICRITFSWELALGFVAVNSMGTVAASVLSMVLSFLSPWLALLPIGCSMALGIARASSMLGLITARGNTQLIRARLMLVGLSLGLTLLLSGVFGGLLMSGVMNRVFALLGSVGSLL